MSFDPPGVGLRTSDARSVSNRGLSTQTETVTLVAAANFIHRLKRKARQKVRNYRERKEVIGKRKDRMASESLKKSQRSTREQSIKRAFKLIGTQHSIYSDRKSKEEMDGHAAWHTY
eukprot:scaffold565733_cov31-Prasinocladus_malaysianus.AAC.1